MDSGYLNDSLNIRDLIEQINEFARKIEGKEKNATRTNDCKATNARSFFVILFSGISASDLKIRKKKKNDAGLVSITNAEVYKEDSLILYLQKLLSGNVPIDSLTDFAERILDEKILGILYSNLTPIINDFTSDSDCYSFFQRLSQQISPRFFQAEEIHNFDTSLDSCDYHKFLFDLLIHGFKTLFNIPAYFSERLLEEALT